MHDKEDIQTSLPSCSIWPQKTIKNPSEKWNMHKHEYKKALLIIQERQPREYSPFFTTYGIHFMHEDERQSQVEINVRCHYEARLILSPI